MLSRIMVWRNARYFTSLLCITLWLLLSVGSVSLAHAQSVAALSGSSYSGPSATYCAGSRFIAFRGTDNRINIKNVVNGALYVFNDTTYATPSLSCARNILYSAWQTADQYHYILIGAFTLSQCNSGNSCYFIYIANALLDLQGHAIQTGYAPALATNNANTMWVAWTGSNNQMFIMESIDDGVDWQYEYPLTDASAESISLAYSPFDALLYVAWPGTDRSHHLNIATYQRSTNLLHQAFLDNMVESLLRPGITIVTDGLKNSDVNDHTEVILSWVGTNNTNLSLGSWDRYNKWNEIIVLNHNTFNSSVSPALTTDGINSYYEFTDTSSHLQEQTTRSGHAAVVFVHGLGGIVDCNITINYSGADGLQIPKSFLIGQQKNTYPVLNGQIMSWSPGSVHMVAYYKSPQNCDDDLTNSLYSQPCAGYYKDGMQASQIGTMNESLYHVSCEFAHYLSYNFSYPGSNVEIVAHSMGGLVVRDAIYQVALHKDSSYFPKSLPNISDIVTLSTPHTGITIANAWPFGSVCNSCLQGEEMVYNQYNFMPDLRTYGQDPQATSAGTDWTIIGSFCDGYVGSDWAVGMGSNHAIRYNAVTGGQSNGCYDHDNILTDTSNASTASIFRCVSNCLSDPVNFLDHRNWASETNRPNSLSLMAYALWYSSW